MLHAADDIVRNPGIHLGEDIIDKLSAVAKLMPLDIFGMDFDVTDDGKVLVFEVNATMNFLSTSSGGLEYPPEAEEALCKVIERYFIKQAAA